MARREAEVRGGREEEKIERDAEKKAWSGCRGFRFGPSEKMEGLCKSVSRTSPPQRGASSDQQVAPHDSSTQPALFLDFVRPPRLRRLNTTAVFPT